MSYPPSGPSESPHRIDKSKAHAVWREHLLTESNSVARLKEISEVSKARTIAECYLINMLKIIVLSVYYCCFIV
ncbi:MAG: hypothetical protein ACOYMA_18895, partial [Bacteroidia bacterium]